jgi:iron complex transport system ATP-binding protein
MAPGGTLHTGAPEDLVLNGAFEAAFQHERVHFDRQSGTFTINTQTSGCIDVRGSGIAATWTARALERAGFQVIAGQTGPQCATIQVEVSTSDGHTRWHVTHDGTTRTHASVYELVRFLRETKHE